MCESLIASPPANLLMGNFASFPLAFRPTTANVAKGFAVFERGENGAILGRRASAPGHYDSSYHILVETDKLIIIFITFASFTFSRDCRYESLTAFSTAPRRLLSSLPKLPSRYTPSERDDRYNILYIHYTNRSSNGISFNKARGTAVLPRNFQSLKMPYTEDSRPITMCAKNMIQKIRARSPCARKT